MTVTEALLDSWDRQCKMLGNLVGTLTPELLDAKPDPEGWTVAFHLAHIHGVRRYWQMNASGASEPVGPSLYTVVDEDYIPSHDLETIKVRLAESGALVRDWVAEQISKDAQQVGNYDHPVMYLQHMMWHEGWHYGLLMLALRVAGKEPSEEWECANIWDLWRLPD